MNDNYGDFWNGFLLSATICGVIFVFILVVTDAEPKSKFQKEAVNHGAAHYDSKTGEFKWNQ